MERDATHQPPVVDLGTLVHPFVAHGLLLLNAVAVVEVYTDLLPVWHVAGKVSWYLAWLWLHGAALALLSCASPSVECVWGRATRPTCVGRWMAVGGGHHGELVSDGGLLPMGLSLVEGLRDHLAEHASTFPERRDPCASLVCVQFLQPCEPQRLRHTSWP